MAQSNIVAQVGNTYYAAKQDRTIWSTNIVTSGVPDFSNPSQSVDANVQYSIYQLLKSAESAGLTIVYIDS